MYAAVNNTWTPETHWSAAVAAGKPARFDAPLLCQVLDALAHGLLLLAASGRVVHANRAARACCHPGSPVVLDEGQLRLSASDQPRLQAALQAARRGQWSMLMLRHAAQPMAVGVVPMNMGDDTAEVRALLVLGRDDELSRLALQFFCQTHQLTPAESAVLRALMQGDSPGAIAARRSVSLATVRSQIVTVREKARAASMRDLQRMVTGLPPVVTALSVDPH